MFNLHSHFQNAKRILGDGWHSGVKILGQIVWICIQMVLNQEMTLEQCEFMLDEKLWSNHWDNEYYYMELSCHEKGTALK